MINKNLIFKYSLEYKRILNIVITYMNYNDYYTEVIKCKNLVRGDIIIYRGPFNLHEDLCEVMSSINSGINHSSVKLLTGTEFQVYSDLETVAFRRKLPPENPLKP